MWGNTIFFLYTVATQLPQDNWRLKWLSNVPQSFTIQWQNLYYRFCVFNYGLLFIAFQKPVNEVKSIDVKATHCLKAGKAHNKIQLF